MEDDKIIMDENPIVDPVIDDTMDTTLVPTDEVIPAVDGGVGVGTPVPVIPDSDYKPEEEIPMTQSCEPTCPEQPVMTINTFFGTIQECVTITWRMHLKTRKHHIHVALNEFYDKALEIVDDIIEQYQGINGVVEEPFINTIIGEGKTEVDYLNELKTFIKTNKSILGFQSDEINSTIDELLGLIDSTIYKISAFCESAVKSFDEFCYEDLNSEE